MNLKVGIVGLPNAGKSTLFNALLKKQAALAANYPFATIEPNVGIVEVPDKRIAELAKVVKTDKLVYATVEFVDIAGLVKGAHSGEGLGNKFLSHIRETNVICYVLRFFQDPEVIHVNNRIDPLEDLSILNEELVLADLESLSKQKEPKMNATKDEKLRYELVQKLIVHLNQNQTARSYNFSNEAERELAAPLNLLTLKPAIYVANMDEEQLKQGGEVLNSFPHQPVISLSAQTESELIDLEESERNELLSSIGMNQPSLNQLAQTAFKTLKLMTFLTAGTLEARAWTIQQDTLAPDAAGTIHTDFAKKFIKADIVSYDDFILNQGWQACREKGLVRSEGKGYIMQNGDVVEFKIGA